MKLRQHADQLEAVFCEDEVEAVELVKAEEQGEEQLQAAELHEASDSMMSAQEAGKTENSAVMKKIIGKKRYLLWKNSYYCFRSHAQQAGSSR